MKLKSFGCSLVFGTDLHDAVPNKIWGSLNPSQVSWPALVAKGLGYDYECYARPGSGNLQIWERLINEISNDEPALYVIGWTWIDRFDYIHEDAPEWAGNNTKWSTITPTDTTDIAKTYYRDLHNEHRDKLTAIQTIKSAIDLLRTQNRSFIMTYMDELIFDQRWNVSPGMIPLQNEIRNYLTQFDGKNFVDYSRDQGHKISDTMHPLESAHEDIAQIILNDLDHYVKN